MLNTTLLYSLTHSSIPQNNLVPLLSVGTQIAAKWEIKLKMEVSGGRLGVP